jgi:co-chaperonin GroES (HSP10)
MMENPSGIVPSEYKVLIKPDKVAEKTQGGIYRPAHLREQEQAAATTGVMIAMSPLAFSYADWPAGEVKPMVSDRVAFGRYTGMSILGKDGEEYRLVTDRDVWAVVWEQE